MSKEMFHSEKIAAAKRLVDENKVHIAAMKKGTEYNKKIIAQTREDHARQLLDLQRLKTQKPFADE
jgi:hypothetical protein